MPALALHPADTPYRFALLSYLPGLEERIKTFGLSMEYTLDYFKIRYDRPDFGAAELLAEGYEVILIYSSFAPAILSRIGYSGVQILKTDMDVIHALLEAKKTSPSIAIPVNVNSNLDIPLLEELCGVTLCSIPYSTMPELQEGIAGAFAKGFRVVAGGGLSMHMASGRQDTVCVPIAPNRHSVLSAISHAMGIARAKRQERLRQEQLLSVLRLFEEGVLFIDDQRRCVYSNGTARRLLKGPREPAQEDFSSSYGTLKLSEVMETGIPSIENIVNVNRRQLVVTTLPVSLHSGRQGAVAFVRDVASVHDFAGRIRASQQQLHGFVAHCTVDDIRGDDSGMQLLKRMIRIYAPHDSPVLIHGETGTGKDLVAQALHNASRRSNAPFVAINCAAIPDSLLESELFGYEEGAFTGARRGGKAGVFELAHTGTLFLDEVGDLGHNAQLRLLRVLETHEVIRVGGDRVIPVDIRVISASHKSLAQLVHCGQFRADLFYRLAVLRLRIPALRQRPGDLLPLLDELLGRYHRTREAVTPGMLRAMRRYAWPGNVRELRSVVESYLILLGGAPSDEDLFLNLMAEWTSEIGASGSPEEPGMEVEMTGDLKERVEMARRRIVTDMVNRCGGNRRTAARELNISYNTLWRILGHPEEDAPSSD